MLNIIIILSFILNMYFELKIQDLVTCIKIQVGDIAEIFEFWKITYIKFWLHFSLLHISLNKNILIIIVMVKKMIFIYLLQINNFIINILIFSVYIKIFLLLIRFFYLVLYLELDLGNSSSFIMMLNLIKYLIQKFDLK